MKRIYSISIALLVVLSVKAQQIGMYGHYFYKPMVYNPAFTGIADETNVFVVSRAQWTDFKNAPQLNIASVDGNLMDKKVGLGLGVITDRKGLSNRIGANVNYAYSIIFNENTQLRFGVSLGVMDHTYDYSKAIVENSNDPTMFNEVQRKTTFDGNAGLAFVFKGLQFGVAVPQVIGNNANFIENSDVRSYYAMARHYMGSLGYKFLLSKEKEISLTPLGLVRYLPNVPLQYDGSLTLNWNNLFWVGGTYKSDYAVSANVGFRLHKQLSVGYSYDIIIGDVGKYAGVSHELMLNFKFGKNKKSDEPVAAKKENLQNEAYVKRMDSIQNQLKQNQAKIDELTKKLEEQSKKAAETKPQVVQAPPVQQTQQAPPAQQTTTPPPAEVKPAVTSETPSTKTRENGVLVASNPKVDFRDTGNAIPPKGYYVVVGTYYYRDLAIAEAQRYKAKGYATTDWVYSGPKGYNYIFMFKCQTKAEAMEKVKIAQQAGATDAWIQALTD